MKTISIRTLIATIVLAAASFAVSAHAQITKAKADIPFMFVYNGHTFAAGHYALNIRPDGVVEVGRSKHVQTGLAQAVATDSTATASSIVFHRAGGKYYLRQIYTAGSSHSLNFMESKAEKHAVTFDVADTSPASSIVVAIDAAR